jgi:hypothetical protein
MNKSVLKTFLIIATVLSASLSFAQVKYSNEFLTIGAGARAHGLSNSMVAHVSDVSAGYWNPAGLTRIDVPFQVSAMHAEWFAGIAKYDFLSFAKKLKGENNSAIGLSVIRLGIDNIPNTLNLVEPDGTINYDNISTFSAADYAVLFSYARDIKIKDKTLSLGGNAKVIRRVIGSFGNAWGFGIDIGAQYRTGNWLFGIVGRDITSTFNAWSFSLKDSEKEVFVATNNEIPKSSVEITLPRFIFGTAYKFNFKKNYSLLATLDFDLTTDGQRNVLISSKAFNIDPRMGLEAAYRNFIFLRIGAGNFQRALDDINGEKEILTVQPNFGIGLKFGSLHIDYALTNIGNVSQVLYSNVFSLSLDLKNRKKKG